MTGRYAMELDRERNQRALDAPLERRIAFNCGVACGLVMTIIVAGIVALMLYAGHQVPPP